MFQAHEIKHKSEIGKVTLPMYQSTLNYTSYWHVIFVTKVKKEKAKYRNDKITSVFSTLPNLGSIFSTLLSINSIYLHHLASYRSLNLRYHIILGKDLNESIHYWKKNLDQNLTKENGMLS